MAARIVRALGGHAAKHVTGKWVNVRLGWEMMRDPEVSGWTKLLVLAIGGAVLAALIALEFPVEMVAAALMPGLGLVLDFFVDGLEVVFLPVLVACAILPWFGRAKRGPKINV